MLKRMIFFVILLDILTKSHAETIGEKILRKIGKTNNNVANGEFVI